MQGKKITKLLLDYLILTVAAFIFALSWEGFMIPNGMSAGGVMGLCTVIQYATGGFIPASYTYFGINAALIIIAVLAVGIGFGVKTIYCIIMSSVAMELLGDMTVLHSVAGEFFYIRETLLIPVMAGFLEALGIGLIMRYGGSTGGTDIIALMINKYWPVSLSRVFFISDLIVIMLVLFLPDKSFSDMMYGLVEIIVFTLVIDPVVGGRRTSYQLMILSSKYQEIADYVINELERGATLLKGQGWYTKTDKNVVLVVIDKKQMPQLSRFVKETDPRAFMSVAVVGNVYGEGFETIKTGISKNILTGKK